MPGLSGLELQGVLAARGVVRPIIFLTGHGDIRMSVQAMKAGAVTFLTKPVRRAELLVAVQDALAKDAVVRQRQREQIDLQNKLATLTAREREVLDLVVLGKLNKQIALELCTAEKTVKTHRGHIMAKLQVRSASALIALLSHPETMAPRSTPQAPLPTDLGSPAPSHSPPTLGSSDERASSDRLR